MELVSLVLRVLHRKWLSEFNFGSYRSNVISIYFLYGKYVTKQKEKQCKAFLSVT